MCGIAGSFAYNRSAPPVDQNVLLHMRDAMTARGPDGAGAWYSTGQRVGLVHRRLAIIDLSDEAAQPMASADGRLVVTFNGEIYNYRELRQRLENKGHVFRTHSDTEVLLHLYAEFGEGMVHELRGMFAFAIWDEKKEVLFLARDPYGIKPLYYSDDGETFSFASQVKALRCNPAVSGARDSAGIAGYYLFGSIPEPFTLYKSIRALPAGTRLWVHDKGPAEPKGYFSVAEVYRASLDDGDPQPNMGDARVMIREALLDSIRAHLVADVPVGAFLSAGIDSGALVGLMRDADQAEIRTVTLAFDEFRNTHNDESVLAEQVGRRYTTSHTTRYVSQREFEDDLPEIVEAMDQPTIDGINTWFVSKAAKEQGLKVAISGLGGDELFGGYPSFQDIPRWTKQFRVAGRFPALGRLVRGIGSSLITNHQSPITISPKAWGMLEYAGSYAGAYLLRRAIFMPWELPGLMGASEAEEGLQRLRPLELIAAQLEPDPGSDHGRVAALESSLYMRNQLLRDVDWAGMAHSLEIRVPLVDAVLLKRLSNKLVTSAPGSGKKWLAESPSVPLPLSVADRPKSGFTVPLGAWTEKVGLLQEWRRVGLLNSSGCHWSRRVAYSMMAAA